MTFSDLLVLLAVLAATNYGSFRAGAEFGTLQNFKKKVTDWISNT